jgi:pimeloyl-ACP methyl ester carboxylesterase
MLRDIEPTRSGAILREGATIRWDVFGDAERTVVLLPTWSIVHTDFWREQIPHLSDRYSVLTFDGLGNGASDRLTEPAMYADASFAEDAVRVMDAAGVATAAMVSVSRGGSWHVLAAARFPERVDACVFIAPSVPLAPVSAERAEAHGRFGDRLEEHPGWLKWNRHFWTDHWPEFLRFFFSKCFTEPDSDEHIDHFVGMGRETTSAVIAATIDAPLLDADGARAAAKAVRCPTLVLHGDGDEIAPLERGRNLASLAGGELIVLAGSGHEPQCRVPSRVNDLLDQFFGEHFEP